MSGLRALLRSASRSVIVVHDRELAALPLAPEMGLGRFLSCREAQAEPDMDAIIGQRVEPQWGDALSCRISEVDLREGRGEIKSSAWA
jgi:hypothetical protein